MEAGSKGPPSSGHSRRRRRRGTSLNPYWQTQLENQLEEEEIDVDEALDAQPTRRAAAAPGARTSVLPRARPSASEGFVVQKRRGAPAAAANSLPLQGVQGEDYIPNTPEDDATSAGQAAPGHFGGTSSSPAGRASGGSTDALLRKLHRRSVEQAKAQAAAAAGDAASPELVAKQESLHASPFDSDSNGGFSRDLTNYQQDLPTRRQQLAAAAAGAVNGRPAWPLAGHQLAQAAQQQRAAASPSFTAAVFSTLQEAKQGGLLQEQREQQQQQRHAAQQARGPALHQELVHAPQAASCLQQQQQLEGGGASPVEQGLPQRQTPTTGGSTGKWSDIDDGMLAQISSLERKAVHGQQEGQQQQQHGAELELPVQKQPQVRQQPAQVLHEDVAAASPAPPAAMPAPGLPDPQAAAAAADAEAPGSSWSDTPDSALLASMERAAAAAEVQRAQSNMGHGAGTSSVTPGPAKQLSFTPTHAAVAGGGGGGGGAAAVAATAAVAPDAKTPVAGGSGGGSAGRQLPTSHLGRSAMQQARQQLQLAPSALKAAAAVEALPAQAAEQPVHQQPAAAHGQVGSAHLAHAGSKRSLAAVQAVERVLQQHSPAAPTPVLGSYALDEQAQQQQQQQQAGQLPWQHVQQASELHQLPLQQADQRCAETAAEHTSAQVPDSKRQRLEPLPALTAAAPPDTVLPLKQEEPRGFDYLYNDGSSDDESGDEEAERNLPVLSQYITSKQQRQQPADQDPLTSPVNRSSGGAQRSRGGLASPLPGQPVPTNSPAPSPPANTLEAYLPPEICAVYRATGVKGELYPWQAECLCSRGVLQGRNLVYCAPTSGGKSLVAEILLLRRILATQRPAMLVLPFVSICSEKSAHLSRLLAPMGREVKDFFGGSHSHAALGLSTGVIVCTIEKANIIVNRMLEDQTLGMLSCLVVDELHMVGDEDRGYQLELLLTKLRYAAAAACEGSGGSPGEQEDVNLQDGLEEGLQVVGMSATLPNVDVVAKWLDATLYVTDFRPVPLRQYLKVDSEIRGPDKQVVRQLSPPEAWRKQDPDLVAWLAKETVEEGHSVLMFCASKKACEAAARLVARLVDIPERQLPMRNGAGSASVGAAGAAASVQTQRPTRESLVEDLRRVPGGGDPGLLEAMARGSAFHHAGLSTEERDIVETAYRCGAVSVLCATSTLAAGVNLPARRVIFRQPYKGLPTCPLDATSYRQMSGRAGRAGVDTHGESILVFDRSVPLARLEALLTSEATPISSCLVEDKRGMKRAMLEVVVSGAVSEPADVQRYIHCTLLSAMNDRQKVADTTIAALKWLGDESQQMLYWDKESDTFQPTAFGRAVLASGLPPEVCMNLRRDLERARQSFVLTTELHLTFLCVPVTESINVDWMRFCNMMQTLRGAEAVVATKVGISPQFVMLVQRERKVTQAVQRTAQGAEQTRICQRFWAALILTDLIAEVDLAEICSRYNTVRGEVQGLQDRAARFATMAAAFCERLGWHDLEALIVKFQSRVLHGVRPEILALSEIPFVRAYTARLLYQAGLRTPEAVAAVKGVDQLVSILAAGQAQGGGDPRSKAMLRRQALKILRGARELLSQRAKELNEQAQEALKLVEKAEQAEAAAPEAGAGTEEAGQAQQDTSRQRHEQQHQQDREAPGSSRQMTMAEGSSMAEQQQKQHVEQQQRPAQTSGHSAVASTSAQAWPPPQPQQQQQPPQAAPPQQYQRRPNPQSLAAVPEEEEMAAAGSGDEAEGEQQDVEALQAAPEEQRPPDPWAYAGRSGVHVLSDVADVRSMREVLQQQGYRAFAFAFDTTSVGGLLSPAQGGPACSSSSSLALPPGPGLGGRGRDGGPTKAEAREAAVHEMQSGRVQARVEGIALSWSNGQAFYVPLAGRADLAAELAPLFASPAVEKATFDLRGQLAAVVKAWGLGVLGARGEASSVCDGSSALGQPTAPLVLFDPLVDVRVAAWLSTPDDKRLRDERQASMGCRDKVFTLDQMLRCKAGPAAAAEATKGMAASQPAVGLRRFEAGRRAAQARKLWHVLCCRLEADQLLEPLQRREMPLVRVIVAMEAAGVGVDEGILDAEQPLLERRIQELEGTAAALAGGPFNLASPQEVSTVLFEKLRLPPPPSAGALKNGGFSTGQEVLLDLQEHAIARAILEHRKLRTLLTRFIHGFKLHLAHAPLVSYPGGRQLKRVRGGINQTCTDTGRLAMDEPNLQTVPKPRNYQVLLSQALASSQMGGGGAAAERQVVQRRANLRCAFVAPPGYTLLSADYRQVEFRLMAHFSGDQHLLRIFSDDSADPFTMLAAGWLKRQPQEVTPEQRGHAKQLTYGLLYGMGPAKLADEMGCSLREAREMQDAFHRSLPGIEAWQARVVADCRRLGYVETLGSRRRYLPNILSGNAHARAAAERQAKNTVCQGSAADLAKAAMVAIHSRLAVELGPGAAQLVLQIHDEFLLEVRSDQVGRTAALVRGVMEGVAGFAALRVPLRVRLAAGPSWGELEELTLEE